MRSLGQHSPDLPPLALHPWYHHAFVPGRLVAHPRNDGSLGPLLDRDALGPGDGSAPNWRGMVGDGTGNPLGEISVISVKAQEPHDRPEEVFDVLGLGLFTASGIGFFLLRKALGGSFGFEFST